MVKPREHRIHMMLSDEELVAIDDWRFANRVATRSDAIRRLCQIGMMVSTDLAELLQNVANVRNAASMVIEQEMAETKGDKDALSEDDVMRLALTLGGRNVPKGALLRESLQLTEWLTALTAACGELIKTPDLADAIRAAEDARIAPALEWIKDYDSRNRDEDGQ